MTYSDLYGHYNGLQRQYAQVILLNKLGAPSENSNFKNYFLNLLVGCDSNSRNKEELGNSHFYSWIGYSNQLEAMVTPCKKVGLQD